MTDPNYTAVCLVIDRSGSMSSIKSDAEGAVREFLDSQRKNPARVTVRIVTFDHLYEVFCPSTPAAEVPEFKLAPRGMTALLDSMGRGITEFGEELARLPEDARPGNVVFAVMTDGMENASQDWTLDRVKELVTRQQSEWSWNIVYLGANQDAISEAGKFGIGAGSALTYSATGKGMRAAGAALDAYVVTASSGLRSAFTDDDRKAATES